MHRFGKILLLFSLMWGATTVHADALLPGAMAVALQRHDAGTFYIDGSVQGYGDLKMLVDTGSSYLVINENVLAELVESGDAEYARELSGSMADGSRRIIPVYRLTRLRLGERCWISDVEAAVFPGSTRAILGMNVLARLAPFAFSAEPAQLALNKCQAEPVVAQQDPNPTAAVAVAAE